MTGAAGRIAREVRDRIADDCTELRLVDRRPFAAVHATESAHIADLADASAIAPLARGVDTIIHLAGYPREADWDTLIPANVQSVVNLWEAARVAGVDRVLYASSNHAVGFYARDQRIDDKVPTRPDSRYGVTKVFMEAVASLYAEKYGVRGFGMRIGYCSIQPTEARMLSHWVHPEDLAALVMTGLTARYDNEIVYGVSANSRSWWDNSRAEALGYRPAHSADRFIDALRDAVSSDPVAEHYQGGAFAADGFVRRVP
jgi:uronate dehydrogenase